LVGNETTDLQPVSSKTLILSPCLGFFPLFLNWGGGMVCNATFNNISAINIVAVSLLVEETAVPGENHRPVASQLHHLMLY
jgi:hypothetical protein